jgi:predicted ATP-dependent Lon-type protease
VGLKSLTSHNLTNVYPNNKNNKKNKVKSKPLELRSRVKNLSKVIGRQIFARIIVSINTMARLFKKSMHFL